MAKPYKTELPRKWNTWREQDMLEFIAANLTDDDNSDEAIETVIEAMMDELDKREETRNARFPDDWDDDDITVPTDLIDHEAVDYWVKAHTL